MEKKKRKTRKKRKQYERCMSCGAKFKRKGNSDLYCNDCREREMKKSKEATDRILSEDSEGARALASAVISRAMKDYISDIKKWHKAYDAELKSRYFADLRAWGYYWKGVQFQFWADSIAEIEGGSLQHEMVKLAFEEIREQRKEKKKCAQKKSTKGCSKPKKRK